MIHIVIVFLTCFALYFLKVIGGELQERLIPVPYSKSSTDQAVSRFLQFFFGFVWPVWPSRQLDCFGFFSIALERAVGTGD